MTLQLQLLQVQEKEEVFSYRDFILFLRRLEMARRLAKR
jgi:hypothetical protein